MKTYLSFSVDGEITELKIKDKSFKIENYANYTYIDKVIHNRHDFNILYNKIENDKKNITSLPFYDKEIYGDFLLIEIDNDNNNLKSLTENKFLKLISISQKEITDYSSDDFNLSDE